MMGVDFVAALHDFHPLLLRKEYTDVDFPWRICLHAGTH